jgi:hypothetical protein
MFELASIESLQISAAFSACKFYHGVSWPHRHLQESSCIMACASAVPFPVFQQPEQTTPNGDWSYSLFASERVNGVHAATEATVTIDTVSSGTVASNACRATIDAFGAATSFSSSLHPAASALQSSSSAPAYSPVRLGSPPGGTQMILTVFCRSAPFCHRRQTPIAW